MAPPGRGTNFIFVRPLGGSPGSFGISGCAEEGPAKRHVENAAMGNHFQKDSRIPVRIIFTEVPFVELACDRETYSSPNRPLWGARCSQVLKQLWGTINCHSVLESPASNSMGIELSRPWRLYE